MLRPALFMYNREHSLSARKDSFPSWERCRFAATFICAEHYNLLPIALWMPFSWPTKAGVNSLFPIVITAKCRETTRQIISVLPRNVLIIYPLIDPYRMLLFSNHAISFSLQSHTPLHVSRCTSPFKGGRARAPRRGLNTAPPRWRQKSGWGLSSLCSVRMTECCRTGFDLGRKACRSAAWCRHLEGTLPMDVFLPYGVSSAFWRKACGILRDSTIPEYLFLWRCFYLTG